MTNAAFQAITQLQYRRRNAEQKAASFESGAEYARLRLGMKRQRGYYEHLLKRKDMEIARLRRQVAANREMWFQVYEDIQKEYEGRLRMAERIMEKKDVKIQEKEELVRQQKQKIKEKIDEVTAERGWAHKRPWKNRRQVD